MKSKLTLMSLLFLVIAEVSYVRADPAPFRRPDELIKSADFFSKMDMIENLPTTEEMASEQDLSYSVQANLDHPAPPRTEVPNAD